MTEPGPAPMRHPAVVERRLGDDLLLGRDLTGRTVVLDPVSAALWSSLDGRVGVDDLVGDVVAALGGDVGQRAPEVKGLFETLGSLGFLDGQLPPGIMPRRLTPPPDPDSCLGKRLGLERATILQVGTGESCFRFGATIPDLVEETRCAFDAVEPGDGLAETFIARIVPVRGRVGRTQQLFDSLGNLLYAGRDEHRCGEALRRTVSARSVLDDEGVWYEGAALLTDDGVVLLHPAIGHEAVGPLRRELQDRSVFFVPSVFLELATSSVVRLPADLVRSEPAVDLPLLGAVVPHDPGAHSVERFVLAMARRWDDEHLDVFLGLAARGSVAEVPQGLTGIEIVERLAVLAGGE